MAPDIARLGGAVYGVSVDDDRVACDFAREMKVTLLKDKGRAIADAFGVPVPLLQHVRRVTFVLDREGVVRGVFHHELQFARHADDALALVRRLAAQPDHPRAGS